MSLKLVLVSSFVGIAASVPILHQTNPGLLEALVVRASAPAAEEETDAGRVKVVFVDKGKALQGRKVRVAADRRGHFQGEFKLNGRPVEAMVDTGATLVAMNLSTARRIGMKLQPDDFVYEVSTANGTAKAASATIGEIQIGKIFVRDVQAAVLEDHALTDTLIGMSFLNRISSFKVDGGGLVLEQ